LGLDVTKIEAIDQHEGYLPSIKSNELSHGSFYLQWKMYAFTEFKLSDINVGFLSVVVFAPNESKPLFQQTLKLPSPVNSALFLPLDEVKNSQISWQKQAVLYFATENQVCDQIKL